MGYAESQPGGLPEITGVERSAIPPDTVRSNARTPEGCQSAVFREPHLGPHF